MKAIEEKKKQEIARAKQSVFTFDKIFPLILFIYFSVEK